MDVSPVVQLAWELACTETAGTRMPRIEPEHILAAVTKLRQLTLSEAADALPKQGVDISVLHGEMALIAGVLDNIGISPDSLRHELRARIGKGAHDFRKGDIIHRSERCKALFRQAEDVARDMRAGRIGIAHLLLALLQDKGSLGCHLLIEKGADLEALSSKIREGMLALPQIPCAGGAPAPEQLPDHGDTPFLSRFGRDLTQEARNGNIGPIVGRRKEILRVIQTLARRFKNNPVLVGEAGVGKTAIAEAIAIRTAQGKDPQVLGGKRIIDLSMSSLVAGTKYRGEFEQRLAHVIEECRSHPEIIVFIDEIHTVIGAGKAEGGMDAANILKPSLARGDLRCIGATTIAEYRRYIETDPALERRFEKVVVPEPSREEAVEILRGLRPRWEAHHGASFTDKALEAAVDLSIRFDGDHQLPDKAIDLADKAGARSQVPMLSMKNGDKKGSAKTSRTVTTAMCGAVTDITIAQVLSEKTSVPLEVITGHLQGVTQSRLLEMEAFLKQKVIGQDEAVERVSQRLLMAHAGIGQRRGPMGVFLFLGPTGVGKTELARSLALFLLGKEEDMIRLDMSEYMEAHSVAKLIGSPPGYVGHEEEGQLTGRLRSRPYSVVLLDEIEKAHPRVFDAFLQVFDEGRLTDSKGRTVDARNAIFIMTSNIPADRQIGFRYDDTVESKQAVLQAVNGRFRAEFINRIDEQVVFRSLAKGDVERILRNMLTDIVQRYSAKCGKVLHFGEEAVGLLLAQGHSEQYGVRHLRRTLQALVEVPLSQMALSGATREWPNVLVSAQDGKLLLQPLPGNTL